MHTSATENNEAAVFTLVISCPDQQGLVAAVSGIVARFGANLVESHNHTDRLERWFFMRNVFTASDDFDEVRFRSDFNDLAVTHRMIWHLWDNRTPQRTVILASQSSHCLADILYRWKSGELAGTIPCVISNHENLRSMVEWHGIPFHYVPIPTTDKHDAFGRIEALIDRHDADTVVLARFMQIMPPQLCTRYEERLINIHHSFLPSFVGANPYQKAHDRGVKLIGATCHYVTTDLDEGPIIEQDVVRVNHADNKEDLVRLGRDVERSVLSRGLRYHLERRVIVHGNRTVVFS